MLGKGVQLNALTLKKSNGGIGNDDFSMRPFGMSINLYIN
jgi:hypothetical protein